MPPWIKSNGSPEPALINPIAAPSAPATTARSPSMSSDSTHPTLEHATESVRGSPTIRNFQRNEEGIGSGAEHAAVIKELLSTKPAAQEPNLDRDVRPTDRELGEARWLEVRSGARRSALGARRSATAQQLPARFANSRKRFQTRHDPKSTRTTSPNYWIGSAASTPSPSLNRTPCGRRSKRSPS